MEEACGQLPGQGLTFLPLKLVPLGLMILHSLEARYSL